VAAIEEVVGEELDRPGRWGRCRVLGQRSLTRQVATCRGSVLGRTPDQMQSSKGRERKVIRAKDAAGCGYGCGYGRSDPQGMSLTGNAPWGTPGHAAIAPWGRRPLRPPPPALPRPHNNCPPPPPPARGHRISPCWRGPGSGSGGVPFFLRV
jgi:hypothetical protein